MENSENVQQNTMELRQSDAKTAAIDAAFCVQRLSGVDVLSFSPTFRHEELEIVKIYDGTCQMLLDGHTHAGNIGDIFILRPFVMHTIRCGSHDLQLQSVKLNLRLLGGADGFGELKYFAPILNETNTLPVVVRENFAWYAQFDENLTALCNRAENFAATLQTLLRLVYENRQKDSTFQKTDNRHCYTVRLALEYIKDNYQTDVKVQHIAEHCGYNEFYLMKLFKSFTGYSCIDYINGFRLLDASKLLTSTNCPVQQIACRVGFNNVSYFNRQFLKLFGQTPKQFRKSAK